MKENKAGKTAPRRDLAVDPKIKTVKSEKPAAAGEPSKRRPFFGLARRKEKWTLTWRGRFVALVALVIFAMAFIHGVHPFLAVTETVDAQYLVIEGWVPNYVLEESIAEFKSKPYTMMFTVGADPLSGKNFEKGDSIAIEAEKRLLWLGVKPELVQAVSAHIKYRNRTLQSAVELRKWFDEHHLEKRFNLVTLGPHSRRSRLLFEKAFAGQAQVGIISVKNREYDPKHWWKYSEGVKEVIGEGVGYIYARFIFGSGESDE